MIEILQPRLFVRSIYDIDLDRLVHHGVRGMILDLDNTLVGWNEPQASDELRGWIKGVKARQLSTCIVSNNMGQRVEDFGRTIGVMTIAKAAKPRRASFRRAMRQMGTMPGTTAVVGDQIFTDILGGNRLQLYTILVQPISENEFWSTRLVRRVESALGPKRAPRTLSD